jgi:hypothetical protein
MHLQEFMNCGQAGFETRQLWYIQKFEKTQQELFSQDKIYTCLVSNRVPPRQNVIPERDCYSNLTDFILHYALH